MRNINKIVISALFVAGMFCMATETAQAEKSQYKKIDFAKSDYKALDMPTDSIKPKSGFTWSTDLIEWLYFAPNIGLEWDIKGSQPISSPSIYAHITWRPGKKGNYVQAYKDAVAKGDFADALPGTGIYFVKAHFEYRWHFRFNERKEQRRGMAKLPMWVDEKFLIKPEKISYEDFEHDTILTKYTRDRRIARKIEKTTRSTEEHKAYQFPGRPYIGVFGDVVRYTIKSKAAPFLDADKYFSLEGNSLNKGWSYVAGLSGGYEFPGFNYNHKRFVQFSLGATFGVGYTMFDSYYIDNLGKPEVAAREVLGNNKIYPSLGVNFKMNFRNTSIDRKYWRPDQTVYDRYKEANRQEQLIMNQMDSLLNDTVVKIIVNPVNNNDSTYKETIDKMMVVDAFRRITGMSLAAENFKINPAYPLPLEGKDKVLDQSYAIDYTTIYKMEHYTDTEEDVVNMNESKTLRFAIELAGKDKAEEDMQSFKDSLKNYYEKNRHRPYMFGEAASADSLSGFISKAAILDTFSTIWGKPLTADMVKYIKVRETKVDKQGESYTAFDSIVSDSSINRKEQYALHIQFHPEVQLDGDDDAVARFQVQLAGQDNARDMYTQLANAFTDDENPLRITIQRSWHGNDTLDSPVRPEEILASLEEYGLKGFTLDNIRLRNENVEYKRDTVDFDFGVTVPMLENMTYIVVDDAGVDEADKAYNEYIKPWTDHGYWRTGSPYAMSDYPVVPGYLDEEGEWHVKPESLIEQINEIAGYELKPWQIETLFANTPTEMRTAPGIFRVTGVLCLHRASRYRRIQIPYKIERVETMEEAGFGVKTAAPAVELDSLGNPIVGLVDSLGVAIDSLGVAADSLAVSAVDSIAAAGAEALENVVTEMTAAEKKAAAKAEKEAKAAAAKAEKAAKAAAAKAEKEAKAAAKRAAKAAKNKKKDAEEAVEEAAEAVTSAATEATAEATETVNEAVEATAEAVTETVEQAVSEATEAVNEAVEKAENESENNE